MRLHDFPMNRSVGVNLFGYTYTDNLKVNSLLRNHRTTPFENNFNYRLKVMQKLARFLLQGNTKSAFFEK